MGQFCSIYRRCRIPWVGSWISTHGKTEQEKQRAGQQKLASPFTLNKIDLSMLPSQKFMYSLEYCETIPRTSKTIFLVLLLLNNFLENIFYSCVARIIRTGDTSNFLKFDVFFCPAQHLFTVHSKYWHNSNFSKSNNTFFSIRSFCLLSQRF